MIAMTRRLAWLSIALLIACPLALAQVTTGTISGVVRDSTGAVIPGVSVIMRNLETGTTRTAVTDEQGRYQAPSLALGNYEVQAQKEGFQVEIRRGMGLTVGREAVVNFELQVGTVTQTLEVNGEAPLVETTASSVSALVETRQIENLPLNGRSFGELALLEPGVNISKFQGSGSFQSGFTTKISIRGTRPEQNSFLLDGTNVMGPMNQIPGSVGGQSLGVDAVREFRVETGTFSAQYGEAAGGVINVITKSGTNQLHGTVFEFLRNSALDARNFFDPGSSPPSFKRNQFGFSAGGPIRKDKTFFFGTYEALRQSLGQTLIATVPTAGARQGLIPNPATGQVQQVTVNPAIVPYLNLFPLPNGQDFRNGTGNLLQSYSQPTGEDYFMSRVDHSVSAGDSLFARYTFDNGRQTPSTSGLYSFISDGNRNRNQYLTLGETHIFSPTLLNSARVGLNRTYQAVVPVIGLDDSLLNRLAFIPGQPLFKTASQVNPGSGISILGSTNTPRIWAWTTFEGADDVTKTVGIHSIKGGIIGKRIQFNVNETINAGGILTFGSLSSFLQGVPNDLRVGAPGAIGNEYWRYTYFGWYIQDDIRVNPRLTLNLGFRHEFYTGPKEKYGNFCNLDIISGPFHCGGSPFSTGASSKDFAPRFGFAWDVLGNGKTSVRGGLGVYYDSFAPTWWYATGDTQPPATRADIANPPFPNLYAALISGNPTIVQVSPTPSGISADPSTMQYSLTLQRQLSANTVLSAGYQGSVGRHLYTRGQENIVLPTILPDGTKFFPAGGIRLRTDLGNTRYVRTQANSDYNGLVVGLQKRLSRGLQFQLSYTYSKSMDTNSVPNTFQLMDTLNWKADRSLSDFDTRHNLSFNYIWDLPFGHGRGLGSKLTGAVARVVGGWQVGGLAKIGSSSPLSITDSVKNWSRNGSTGSSIMERPNLLPGKSNNPVLGSPDKWFDPTVLQVQQLGFYGNLGRNTLSGPNQMTVDFSLLKNLDLPRVSEQFHMQFRAEIFNILNRANFAVPPQTNLDLYDSNGNIIGNVGRLTTTSTSSRQIQFGLKFLW